MSYAIAWGDWYPEAIIQAEPDYLARPLSNERIYFLTSFHFSVYFSENCHCRQDKEKKYRGIPNAIFLLPSSAQGRILSKSMIVRQKE